MLGSIRMFQVIEGTNEPHQNKICGWELPLCTISLEEDLSYFVCHFFGRGSDPPNTVNMAAVPYGDPFNFDRLMAILWLGKSGKLMQLRERRLVPSDFLVLVARGQSLDLKRLALFFHRI